METHFSPEQLAESDLADAAAVIGKCIHCGFCNATCPTFLMSQDESDGPRGRIGIMQSLLETGRDPTPAELNSLDRCLTCQSCHSTCSAGVEYTRLMGITRARLERRGLRPWKQRALRRMLAETLPDGGKFARRQALARLARPIRSILPAPLPALIEMSTPNGAASAPLPPGLYAPQGEAKLRVLLMTGCVQGRLDSEIDHATVRLLTRLGAEVLVPPAQGCCGALGEHLGHSGHARAQAARMLDGWVAATKTFDADRVVINATGCGFHIRDWGYHFQDDPARSEHAARFASRVEDVAKTALSLGISMPQPVDGLADWPVALHIPCSQVHGMGVYMEPKSALEAVGFTAAFAEDLHICCGAAGTHALFQPDVSAALKAQKLEKLAATGGRVIASGNMGCNAHLRAEAGVPVVHVAQLLDWATGGPKPAALESHSG